MRRFIKLLWPLYLAEFFICLGFYYPIDAMFCISRGLNITDIGLITTGVYTASFLLEYPTGIFADKYGRKKSMAVYVALLVIALFVNVTAYSVIQFFIGGLLMGASAAFSSGAFEAFIYDSLKEKKLQKYNSKVLGSIELFGSIGVIIASLLGAALFVWKSTAPYWLSILTGIIAFFFILRLREPNYKNKGKAIETFTQFKAGVRNVWFNPVLFSLFILYIPLFFFEDAWYTAQQPILVGLGLPTAMLGAYFALKYVFVGLGGYLLPKLLGRFRNQVLLAAIVILEAVVWFGLGLNNLWAIIIFGYSILYLQQLFKYIDAAIIHKHIQSNVRATTLSARQMMFSLIWIFNPWFMGYLVNNFSRNWLFPLFGIISLVSAGAVFLWRKKYY